MDNTSETASQRRLAERHVENELYAHVYFDHSDEETPSNTRARSLADSDFGSDSLAHARFRARSEAFANPPPASAPSSSVQPAFNFAANSEAIAFPTMQQYMQTLSTNLVNTPHPDADALNAEYYARLVTSREYFNSLIQSAPQPQASYSGGQSNTSFLSPFATPFDGGIGGPASFTHLRRGAHDWTANAPPATFLGVGYGSLGALHEAYAARPPGTAVPPPPGTTVPPPPGTEAAPPAGTTAPASTGPALHQPVLFRLEHVLAHLGEPQVPLPEGEHHQQNGHQAQDRTANIREYLDQSDLAEFRRAQQQAANRIAMGLSHPGDLELLSHAPRHVTPYASLQAAYADSQDQAHHLRQIRQVLESSEVLTQDAESARTDIEESLAESVATGARLDQATSMPSPSAATMWSHDPFLPYRRRFGQAPLSTVLASEYADSEQFLIEGISKHVFRGDEEEKECECPICYNRYDIMVTRNSEDAVRINVCGHVFGRTCLKTHVASGHASSDQCPKLSPRAVQPTSTNIPPLRVPSSRSVPAIVSLASTWTIRHAFRSRKVRRSGIDELLRERSGA